MKSEEETVSESKNIKVYVRILPLLKRCENCAKISQDKKTIYVRCLQDMKQKKILQSKDPVYWSFETNGIFYDCSQDDIYRETTGGIINNVLDGANFVLISCGQTGTGKSFTIGGLHNNWEHRGIVPRLISGLIIEKKRAKRRNEILFSLSYVEFRGRKVKDLLNPDRENFDNSQDVFKKIRRVNIKDEKDALEHIFQGEGRRAIAEFSTYPICHLGTAVITFHVRNTCLITSWAVVSESKIHIVEMAGIDNTAKSSCLKPAQDVIAANSVKLELERCFENLGKIEKTFGPTSCLLKYLDDTLRLQSIIRIIGHVRVTEEDLDVTLSTLRFVGKIGKIAKHRMVKVTYNVRPQTEMFVEKLKEDIERLKTELCINEMFYQQEAIMNVSANRAQQIEKDFIDFLNGIISDVELVSLSQTQIIARIMKDLYVKINVEKEKALRDAEKCENALRDSTRVISKTSVHNSTNDNGKKSFMPKNHPFMINAETSEESDSDRVGTLDDHGITFGPGIPEIPATSAAGFSNMITKISSKKCIHKNNHDDENESLNEKSYELNERKTFERLQEMMKRLIKTSGSLSKKRWSVPVSRSNRCYQ